MLTVQPRSINYQNSQRISFKEARVVDMNNDNENAENIYEKKVKYYKKQAKNFDSLSKDEETPTTFKKMMKGFKVVSQALFEGWLVWWGAKKGANFVKGSLTSEKGKVFVKTTKDILRPVKNGIKTSGEKIVESYNRGIDNIKASKFVKSMKKNAIGKYVVAGLRYLEKGIRFIGKMIKSGYDLIAKPFRNKTNSEKYDTFANYASVILGVGAGAAGAYNAATDADVRRAELAKKKAIEEAEKQEQSAEEIEDEV